MSITSLNKQFRALLYFGKSMWKLKPIFYALFNNNKLFHKKTYLDSVLSWN